MAYIGAEPLPGQNREVDDISSSFNGSTTAFTLQVNGLNVSPETANNILVNIGGVIQNPGTDYTIAASTITFTTAPAAGLSFFAIILGAGINTATVADDTIGASKLIDTAVTAGSYTTADITVDAQGRITAAASGTISGAEIADQAVTNAKVNNSAAIARTKLANVDVVDDTSPQLGGDLASNGNDILMADTDRIKIGTGTDCHIHHDGTDTFISNDTGDLVLNNIGGNSDDIFIRSKDDITLQVQSSENAIKCIGDGAVEVYHNNSKKLETSSTGLTVTGQIQINNSGGALRFSRSGYENYVIQQSPGFGLDFFNETDTRSELRLHGDGDVRIPTDAGKLSLGASQDLKLFHDGTDSHIQNTQNSGELKIRSHQTDIKNADNNETQAVFHENGAVELYYDNSKKLETISGGITVTGGINTSAASTFATSAFTGNITLGDNVEVVLGNSSDLIFRHIPSSRHEILAAASAPFQIRADTQSFLSENGVEDLIKTVKDGAVDLYFDSSKKLSTFSEGIESAETIRMRHGTTIANRKQTVYQAISNGTSHTFTTTNGHGGGTVTVVGIRNGNSTFATTTVFPFALRSTAPAGLGSSIVSVGGAQGGFSYNVAGANQGITVTNNDNTTGNFYVTFDITGSVA